MRIVLVGLSYPFRGGISHYTTVLHQQLEKKHQTILFGLKRQYPQFLFPGQTQLDQSQSPLTTEAYDCCIDSINPYSWWQTYQKIKVYSPDFVLFSWWHPFFSPCYATISWLLKKRAKISCCFLCHNIFSHEKTVLDKYLVKLGLSKSSVFIVHSQEQAKELDSLFPDRPVLINPHPRYEFFVKKNNQTREQARKAFHVEDKKVILFFGLIRPYKGLKYLLESMLLLPEQDKYHLLLIGEFYHQIQHYQILIDRLLLRKQLTLVNHYIVNEQVGQYFKAADVFVAPYVDATQSGAIQLAYSFGLPVIATRVGGLPEMVKDKETGLLVEPKDSQGLKQVISNIFKAGLITKFSKNIAQQNGIYSWDKMLMTIEKIPGFLEK